MLKLVQTGTFIALAAIASSCSSPSTVQPQSTRQMWVSEDIRTASINQAIIAQRTLYPYHFVDDSTELNELGQRDLEVLAEHFADHAGSLSIRRGRVSNALFQERLESVSEELIALGVGKGKVRIHDGHPGGDGISSERVIGILQDTAELEAAPVVESSGN